MDWPAYRRGYSFPSDPRVPALTVRTATHPWRATALKTMGRPRSFIALGVAAWLSLGAADSLRVAAPPPSPPFKPPASALFADDFSSDSLSGWRADSLATVWRVRDGVLRGDLPDVKQAHSFLFAGDPSWTDYAVDLDVCGMRGVDKGVVVRVQNGTGLGVDLRGPGYQDVLLHRREWPMGRASAINGNAVWHHLRVESQIADRSIL